MTAKVVIDPDTVELKHGGHKNPKAGVCMMELVAYVAGEKHSDHPACTSPVIASFLRSWNDSLDDKARQRLRPYVRRVIGTNTGAADDETRAWLATDWLVRVHTPAWLDLAGMTREAAALRALPQLTSTQIAVAVQLTIEDVRAKADAARDAARAAAGDAARDAAWDAARDAAGAAAGDAAWDAAWDAAGAALKPTELQLQDSAFDLLDRMIAVGATADVTA